MKLFKSFVFGLVMSSYKHASGHEKRQKKKDVEKAQKKQQNAMLKYILVPPSDQHSLEPTNASPISQNSEFIVTENTENLSPNSNRCNESQSNELELEFNENRLPSYPADLSDWPVSISDDFQNYFVQNKPQQNIDCIQSSTTHITICDKITSRSLTPAIFIRKKANSETINREWLVYSPKNNRVYCYVCKLFSEKTIALINGLNDWKNIHARLSEHENSLDHIVSISVLVCRTNICGRIDSELEQQYSKEKQYWRNVLKRVVATIKFLSRNGLAFRGSNSSLYSTGNGNYLSALQYLSEFDPFLASHFENIKNKSSSGKVTYLSSTICDEFIGIIGEKVKKNMVKELLASKYYSLIIDSTPDITHSDQLTIIIRYLLPNGKPVERFCGFIPIYSHTGENLESTVINYLNKMNIDLLNCKGQSYDNASNMSGKYNGLQARLKNRNKAAHYIPCSTHSLNLVGNYAAECCTSASIYFDLIQNIYVFFSASTHRWNVLEEFCKKNKNPLTVKRISDTRWSARADAVNAIINCYNEIKKALTKLSNDDSQKKVAQIEAKEIEKK